MSAGSKLVQMRTVARDLIPYLNHLDACEHFKGSKCTCQFMTVVERARRLANVDPARTGRPHHEASPARRCSPLRHCVRDVP